MYEVCSMLTKKQKNLLIFINKKIRSSGISPSYEEMKNSLNLKSKSGIHRLISALEERGFVKRLAHKARALEDYGLKVKGDSMIEAGIADGDTVIIKKVSNVDNGQIAVVLIDDQEATLKRVRKKGNTIALEAANRNYGTKIYAANRIKIQGKLVSLYRNFH